MLGRSHLHLINGGSGRGRERENERASGSLRALEEELLEYYSLICIQRNQEFTAQVSRLCHSYLPSYFQVIIKHVRSSHSAQHKASKESPVVGKLLLSGPSLPLTQSLGFTQKYNTIRKEVANRILLDLSLVILQYKKK